MADTKPLMLLSTLAQSENAVSRLLIHTTYGLIVEATADGALDIRLSDGHIREETSQRLKAGQPGYRYDMWPNYHNESFVSYKSDWPGNPAGETDVDEHVLKERYGKPWAKSFESWVGKYMRAFEAQECHLGSQKDPFPDRKEEAAWILEGLLLAAWLALQPGVDAVEYDDDLCTSTCTLEKTGLSATVAKLLDKLSRI
jgi:hypothetical protein